ncbi:MAG: hypothetical protein PHE17_14480 [Thiothrix sp.]|nr:hypothetical protein [Thiothrix sp.]MDD5394216.1 hypothetical protein [Thiothrix sp.]
MTTFSHLDEAGAIARRLLGQGLAACINTTHGLPGYLGWIKESTQE